MLESRRFRILRLLLALAVGLSCAVAQAEESSAEALAIVVIVHKNNQKDQISMTELRRIFTLEKQTWSDGDKIRVYVQEAGGFEHEIMLSEIYRAGEADLEKLWVAKLADNIVRPKPSSNKKILRSVARDTQAIGLIAAAESDGTVKVLRVNGLPPESPVYPLKGKSP